MGDGLEAEVSRTFDGLDHVNTLAPIPEVRKIVLAQGKEFRNGDQGMHWRLPELLRLSGKERLDHIDANVNKPGAALRAFPSLKPLPAIPLVDGPGGSFVHFSLRQGVIYSIRVVNSKPDFIAALRQPELHVIYSGHARYGRGPCFGSGGTSRGEEWEEGHGVHPNADGITRMGYPFLSVPAYEPIEHGYTANLVSSDAQIAAGDCDPDLRRRVGELRPRTLAEIDAAIAAHVAHDLKLSETLSQHVRNNSPESTWWTFGGGKHMEIVLHAGWETTFSDPDELGRIDPVCRVFCHFGCSTFKHNYPVVRKLKGWKREGNEKYAYWTTDLSTGIVDIYWLQSLLTYPTYNAWQSWEPSLAYAVRKTNAALGADRARFKII